MIAGLGGAGSFVGAVLAGRSERRLGVGRTILLGMLGFTIGSAFIPLAPAGALVLGAACLIVQQLVGDSAGTLFEITQVSLTQSVVEDRLLGRVNGSIRFFEDVFQLAGTIAGGVIAEVIGLRGAMAFGVLGGVVALGVPVVLADPAADDDARSDRSTATTTPSNSTDELPLTE